MTAEYVGFEMESKKQESGEQYLNPLVEVKSMQAEGHLFEVPYFEENAFEVFFDRSYTFNEK